MFSSSSNGMNRREWLTRAGNGFGGLAAATMLSSATHAGVPQHSPHHAPRAKSIIWLFMNGGPSSIDLFDEKPLLQRWAGKMFPHKIETLFPHPGPVMPSPFQFKRYGHVELPVSEVYPHLARLADELTVVHSCHGTAQNHTPACYAINSGATRVGAPSIGSWVTYGLGCETQDLPAYVVMFDRRAAPEGGANLWDAAYLPGEAQAVPFRPGDEPILYLQPPNQQARGAQPEQLKLLDWFNQQHRAQRPEHAGFERRMQNFETAFRMQFSAPDVVDLSRETAATRNLYGVDDETTGPLGTQLLMARKLVERGVRFVQIYHGGYNNNWDHHGELETGHRQMCAESDQPIAGLLTDLKQRGLLDDTLVVWGGEFGRTPTSQDRFGRDHNPFGFTTWLAGGGVKRGFRYGLTDEFGYQVIDNPVSMHDLHATILHLMGLDHEQLTFRFNGREQSLVNGLGDVVHDLIA